MRLRPALLLLILGGAALRLAAAADNLWLDEIWSWFLARGAASPLAVFTGIHHDNNNYLNTLWLYLCPDQVGFPIYRLHSLAAGVATLWLMARVCAPAGEAAAGVAVLLAAASSFFIAYAAEARGYALAGLFALLGLLQLRRFLDGGGRRAAAAFALCGALGFLSHLSFLTFFLPAALCCAVRLRAARAPARRALADLALLFGPPAALVGLLWIVDLRLVTVGGAPLRSVGATLLEVLALPAGAGPGDRAPLWLGAAAALVLLLAGLRRLQGTQPGEALLFALVLGAAPLVLFGLAPAGLVYPRHFYVPLVLLVPVLAQGLLWTWERGAPGRLVAAALVLLCLLQNGRQTLGLLRLGRGGYLAAVELMARETPGREILVGGDHDFRNGMTLGFYAQFVPPGKALVYLPRPAWPTRGPGWSPDWLVLHGDHGFTPPPRVPMTGPARYTLRRDYPFAGPVGLRWALYRRVEGAP